VGEVWNTYLISDPNLTLTPKNLYFINGFEGVGEERLMTSGCVLTFLWGRLHREKKDWEKKCFPITSPAHHREKKY
jgi:hypothetical protein